MPVVKPPCVAAPASVAKISPSPKSRPLRRPDAFALYRKARKKEIRATGVKLPLASVLSKQFGEEWRGDISLRLKFEKLAGELRQDTLHQGKTGAVPKVPARRKSEKVKTNKNVKNPKKTKLVVHATPPSVILPLVSRDTSHLPAPLEAAQLKVYSPPPYPPPPNIRTVSNVSSPHQSDTSLYSSIMPSTVPYPFSETMSSSSSSYQSPSAYVVAGPSPRVSFASDLPHVFNYSSHADLTHIRPWPARAREVPQPSSHVSHSQHHYIPIPGLRSPYPSLSPSIPSDHVFKQQEQYLQPLSSIAPLYHPTPQPRPLLFSFLPYTNEGPNFPSGATNDAAYGLPARVPNPLRWMAGPSDYHIPLPTRF